MLAAEPPLVHRSREQLRAGIAVVVSAFGINSEPPVGGSRRTDAWMTANYAIGAAAARQQDRLAEAFYKHRKQCPKCNEAGPVDIPDIDIP